MSEHNSHAMHSFNRLERRYEANSDQLADFLSAQAAGDRPDPEAFGKLLEVQAIARRALEAQHKLHEKPLKTVLGEFK